MIEQRGSFTTFLISLALVLPAMMMIIPVQGDVKPLATSIDVALGNSVTVDGVNSTGEWTDAQTLAITQSTSDVWYIKYKHTMTDLCIMYEFKSSFLGEIYFDINNDQASSPQPDDLMMHSSAANYEKFGTGSGWPTSQGSPSGWSANIGFNSIKEFKISYSKLGITAGEAKTMGIMFRILSSPPTDKNVWPDGASTTDPSTWGTMDSTDLWSDGTPLNHPPVLMDGMVDMESGTTEDQFTFSVLYSDQDNDAPSIGQVVVSGTAYGMTTGSTDYIGGTTFKYQGYLGEGTYSFYFLFNDGTEDVRLPVTGEFEGPEVIRHNKAPEMVSGEIPSTYGIDEDSGEGNDLIDLEALFSDDRNDGDLRFDITFQEDPSILFGSIDGHFLDVSQLRGDWFGTVEFRVRAMDLGLDGYVNDDDLGTESNTFTIEVSPVNDAPVIARVGTEEVGDMTEVVLEGENSAVEDRWFNITIDISDADLEFGGSDEISHAVNVSDVQVVPAFGTGPDLNLSFLPTQEDVGWKHLEVSIEDSGGETDIIQISIEVANVNDAPVIDHIQVGEIAVMPVNGTIMLDGEHAAIEGEWYNFTMVAIDQDTADVLRYSRDLPDPNVQLDEATGEVSVLAGKRDIGTMGFIIRVTDNAGAFDTVTVLLNVTNRNDPPVIERVFSMCGSFVFAYDEMVNLSCSVHDPDIDLDVGEVLTYTWTSSIDGEIGTGILLIWDPVSSGEHEVTLTVTDSGGLTASSTVTVTILDPPDRPQPNDIDQNATTPKKVIDKEGAPMVMIVFIVIAGILILAGVVFILSKGKKKIEEGPVLEEENEGSDVTSEGPVL